MTDITRTGLANTSDEVDQALAEMRRTLDDYAYAIDEGMDRVDDDFETLRNKVRRLQARSTIIEQAATTGAGVKGRTKSTIADWTMAAWRKWNEAYLLCWELRKISETDPAIVEATQEATEVAEYYHQRWNDHRIALQPYEDAILEENLDRLAKEIAEIKIGAREEPIPSVRQREILAKGLKENAYAIYGVSSVQHKKACEIYDYWNRRANHITRNEVDVGRAMVALAREMLDNVKAQQQGESTNDT